MFAAVSSKARIPVRTYSRAKTGVAIMKAMGKNYTGINYEGAVHGFLRAQNDPKTQRDEAEEAANLAAAKDGWPRTVSFLKKNLGLK